MIESTYFPILLVSITSAATMMGIACYLDLKKREIDDRLWIVFGSVAVVTFVFNIQYGEIAYSSLLALIIVPVSILLCRLGLIGGADGIALSILSLFALDYSFVTQQVTPFTILTNACFLITIPIVLNISRNLACLVRNEKIFDGYKITPNQKIAAILLGYKTKNPRYAFSMEEETESGKRLTFVLHNAEKTEYCRKSYTWVTPGIPFMLMITGGFFIQLFFGDIFFRLFGGLQ